MDIVKTIEEIKQRLNQNSQIIKLKNTEYVILEGDVLDRSINELDVICDKIERDNFKYCDCGNPLHTDKEKDLKVCRECY